MATTYMYNASSAPELTETSQNNSTSHPAGESIDPRRPRTMADSLPTTSLTTSPTPLHRSSVSAVPSLDSLPREILQQVLSLLPWQSIVNCSFTCKTISHVVNNSPLLWRQLCLENYTSWHAEHEIQKRAAGSVLDTDWKELFEKRKRQDRKFEGLFNRVLERQDGRIDFIAGITERGNDARDLMEHFRQALNDPNSISRTPKEGTKGKEKDTDDAPLARSYWANEILGSLNRHLALEEITQILAKPTTYPLINGLWAIDMFVAESPPLTLPQLLQVLDNIAQKFKLANPDWHRISLRNRALKLAEFVREHDLVGVRSEETYHDLQNSCISIALCEGDHPSLPLVGHAIYAAVAERVGINAGLTNTSGHVFVTVLAPEGISLDNSEEEDNDSTEANNDHETQAQTDNSNNTTTSSTHEARDPLDPSYTMFLNPFTSPHETPLSYLRSIYGPGIAGHGRGVGGLLGFANFLGHGANLAVHGPMDPTNEQLAKTLKPASTRDMMFRMARNLQETMRGAVHGARYQTVLETPASEFFSEHVEVNPPEDKRGIGVSVGRGGGGGRGQQHDGIITIQPTLLNPYRASYCSHFLQSLLDDIGGLQHRALYNFVEGFMHHFKETDSPLVTQFMLSAFYGSSGRSMGFGGWDVVGGGEDVLGAAEVGREEGAFVETVLAQVRREDGRVRVPKGRGRLQKASEEEEGGRKVGEEEEERVGTMAAQIDASFGAEPRDRSVQTGSQHEGQSHAASSPPPSSSSRTTRRGAVLEGSYSSMKAEAEEEPSSTKNSQQVRYRVGDLFRHRRYRYRAVITGWDSTCQASEEWMEQMGVDTLPKGRAQSFYHVLVEDHSVRYVAEENIDVIRPKRATRSTGKDWAGGMEGGKEKVHVEDGVGRVRMSGEGQVDLFDDAGGDRERDSGDDDDNGEDREGGDPPMEIMRIAGRYFKRWDVEEGRFVSNVRDEYPDD